MRRALLCAVFCAAAVRAQEEPTPFWMPPPPPAKKEPAKPKKKKPVQIEPMEIKEKPPASAAKPKPPPAKPAPKPEQRPEPTWIEPPPRAAEPAPHPKHAPIEPEPRPSPAARVPSAPPASAPAPPAPSISAPAPAPPRTPAEAPVLSRNPAPRPEPSPPLIADPVPLILPEPEPPDTSRTISISALFGAWAKPRSDSSGRSWEMAYGLRFSYALFPSLDLDLALARAGGTEGSPFVSTSLTHNLAVLRAFWVLGDRFALLLGGGGGVALAQSHYSLLPSNDPGVVASGLDATAIKSVMEITAAGRARFFGGLEARAEVSVMARDGRLELLPLLGLGAAF